jgi:phage terminase large subunit-like protein
LYEADELQALDETQKPLRLRALHDFTNWGRPNQHEPRHEDWRLWLILGGRGSGKSRTGAEWVKQRIRYANRPLRVALVGPSLQETRAVMVEGDSGLLSVHEYDDEPPAFLPTKREIVFANGSIAQLFSADSPDSLRGPQFHLAWCDELAKWRYAEEAWNMLQFALRLGDRPQQTVTTTPRPLRLLKSLMQDSQTVLNQGGDLVTEVLRNIDPSVPVRPVRANRGKFLRAEPVAALYEQGRVSHVGAFPELEDEMCSLTLKQTGTLSPDRLDALVWALTELLLRHMGEPRIRSL